MEMLTYQFNSGAINRTVNSDGRTLSIDSFTQKEPHQIEFSAITGLKIKKVSLTGGSTVRLFISYEKDGKTQIFPDQLGIESLRTDENTIAIIEELKSRVPNLQIEDTSVKAEVSVDGDTSTVKMGISVIGSPSSASLPPSLPILIATLGLSVFIIPIPIGIYALIKGYRLSWNNLGIKIKKIRSKTYSWHDIKAINFTEISYEASGGYNMGEAIRIDIVLNTDKKVRIYLNYPNAKAFAEMLATKNLVSREVLDRFSI